MPRSPRLDVPGLPVHIVQRGNNRQECFLEDSDYSFFLHALQEACQDRQCQLHAFVLMTNHVHLLITPLEKQVISLMMMDLGRRYVRYFNDMHDRTGTLWEGRFKSSLVETGRYCLACYRYIELNPVRAGMLPEPVRYRWSSYRTNAFGIPSSLITPHPEWLELGASDKSRRRAYRALFEETLRQQELKAIRLALQKDRPVGGNAFQKRIEEERGVKLGSGQRGRPAARAARGQVQ